jgi:hypothetical protein
MNDLLMCFIEMVLIFIVDYFCQVYVDRFTGTDSYLISYLQNKERIICFNCYRCAIYRNDVENNR